MLDADALLRAIQTLQQFAQQGSGGATASAQHTTRPIRPRPRLIAQKTQHMTGEDAKQLCERQCSSSSTGASPGISARMQQAKEEKRKETNQASWKSTDKDKALEQALEAFLEEKKPGWRRETLLQGIATRNSSSNKQYIMDWLQRNEAKYTLIQSYQHCLPDLAELLHKPEKLTEHISTSDLQTQILFADLRSHFYRSATERDRQWHRGKYLKALKKEAIPYLLAADPGTLPVCLQEFSEVKPLEPPLSGGSAVNEGLRDSSSTAPDATVSHAVMPTALTESPLPSGLSELDQLLVASFLSGKILETPMVSGVTEEITEQQMPLEKTVDASEQRKMRNRKAAQKYRGRNAIKMQDLESALRLGNSELTPEQIKAGITINPALNNPMILTQFLNRFYSDKPGLLHIDNPDHLPKNIKVRFKNYCSAIDSRNRKKRYIDSLKQDFFALRSRNAPPVDEPMEINSGASAEGSASPGQQVLDDDHQVKKWITQGQGFYIQDSLPYVTYLVEPETRKALISESLCGNLKTLKRWPVNYFSFQAPGTDPEDMAFSMQRAISELPEDSTEILGKDWSQENGQPLPDCVELNLSRNNKEYRLTLKPLGQAAMEGTLTLYNRSPDQCVRVMLDKDTSVTVKPREGIILQPVDTDLSQWMVAGQYLGGTKQIETNPLIRDSEPLVVWKPRQRIDDSSAVGEYFISRQALADLSAYQSAKAGKPAPAICVNAAELKTELEKFKDSSLQSCSLILGYEKANHYVAARLVKLEGKIVAYIHETLDQTNPVSCQLQKMLLKGLGRLFSDIYFLTPEFVSQKDFSSCGPFTLKALRAFDKRPALDQWLLKLVEEKPASRVQKPAGKGEYSISRDSGIALVAMPPVLLKLYQGKPESLTPAQRSTVVSRAGKDKPVSLEEYISGYQKSLPSLLNPEVHSTPNFAGYCKRYKYLLKWENILAGKPSPDNPIAGTPVYFDLGQTDEVIKEKLQPIKYVASAKKANLFLKQQYLFAPEVSEDHWSLMLDFEALVLYGTPVRTERLLELHGWFSLLGQQQAPENRVLDQLTQLWIECIQESPNAREKWKNKSVPEITQMLLEQI